VNADRRTGTIKPGVGKFVAPEHILLGLVAEGTGAAANVLKELGVDPRRIRHEVEKLVLGRPVLVTMGHIRLTRRDTMVVEYAVEEARSLNRDYIGSEHLLLGLLRQEEGVAAQVLLTVNLGLKEVRDVVLRLPADQLDAAVAVRLTAILRTKSGPFRSIWARMPSGAFKRIAVCRATRLISRLPSID
jgi:ATP-dependent Clp protease ATP-binding subunit ClpA